MKLIINLFGYFLQFKKFYLGNHCELFLNPPYCSPNTLLKNAVVV